MARRIEQISADGLIPGSKSGSILQSVIVLTTGTSIKIYANNVASGKNTGALDSAAIREYNGVKGFMTDAGFFADITGGTYSVVFDE